MSHPQDLSLVEQAAALRRGTLSASDLLEATVDRLAERDGALNSTPIVFASVAREQLSRAPRGPLYGVPLTVKDMFALPWRGARNGTCHEMIEPRASGAYARLRDAGAIVVGVANQHELGMGSTGSVSAYGPTHNPWDLARSAGGSSSGSAAAVAARLVGASLGSDSGGSTRIPAAWCGVTGLKLTYGSVPYDGYFGARTTFSAPGALGRDAADVRLLSEVLLGRSLLGTGGTSLRVARLAGEVFDDVSASVREAIEHALGLSGWDAPSVRLNEQGLILAASLALLAREIDPPPAEQMGSLSASTRASLLASQLLGTELIGTELIERAQSVRVTLRRELARAFVDADVLAVPSTPSTAPRLDEGTVTLPSGPMGLDQANLRLNVLANLTGVPSISVPVGLDASGLPIGLSLLAPWGEEARLLEAAAHLERASERAFLGVAPPLARG